MSEPDGRPPAAAEPAAAEPESAEPAHAEPAAAEVRRRRAAEVFGDVLPEATRDDVDGPGENVDGSSDSWYRSNRPPHHG